jgi:hypothetical protein
MTGLGLDKVSRDSPKIIIIGKLLERSCKMTSVLVEVADTDSYKQRCCFSVST